MAKRLFSKARKKKTEPSHGLATHRLMAQRREEIRNAINDAMQRLPMANWKKNSPEIQAAQEQLDEIVTRFIEGAADRLEVKEKYQIWSRLHVETKKIGTP